MRSSLDSELPVSAVARWGGAGHAWAFVAAACFGVAVVAALGLHLLYGGTVDPVRQVVSDYALSDPVGFAVCVAALAAGTWCLLGGLRRAGLPVPASVAVLLWCWCLGLVVCAFFPTVPTGAPMTVASEVHRYAGLVLFVALPAAAGRFARHVGVLPAHRLLAKRMRRRTRWAWGSLAVFLLCQLPVLLPSSALADWPLVQGAAQRLVFVVYLVLLGELVLAVLRSGRKPC